MTYCIFIIKFAYFDSAFLDFYILYYNLCSVPITILLANITACGHNYPCCPMTAFVQRYYQSQLKYFLQSRNIHNLKQGWQQLCLLQPDRQTKGQNIKYKKAEISSQHQTSILNSSWEIDVNITLHLCLL